MDIIDLSTVPGNTENFEEFIDQMCRRLGVEYGSYATMNPMTGAVQGYATFGVVQDVAMDVEGLFRRGNGFVHNITTGSDRDYVDIQSILREGAARATKS